MEELGVAEEICDTLDMPAASIRTVGILKEDLKDLREAQQRLPSNRRLTQITRKEEQLKEYGIPFK